MATTHATPTIVHFLERPHPHSCRWIWWQLPLLPQLPSIFQRDLTPTLGGESDGNYPYYPNYRLYFRETPSLPLELNLMATTLTTPTTVCFLKRPHPHFVFILCAWCTIWVSILIKLIVLSLFLTFTRPLLSSPPTFWRVLISQSKIRHFICSRGILPLDPRTRKTPSGNQHPNIYFWNFKNNWYWKLSEHGIWFAKGPFNPYWLID